MKKIVAAVLVVLMVVLMSVTVFAEVTFVPSIEKKLAPEVIPVDPPRLISFYIYNKNGEIIRGVPITMLIVTPLAKVEECLYFEIKDSLNDAKDEIESVETLAELNEHLNDIAKSIDPNYTADDFIVTDLFDISVVDENGKEVVFEPGTYARITFDFRLEDDDDIPVFLHRLENGEWVIVDQEEVERNEDNTITITLDELGNIAALTAAKDYNIRNPIVISPQTGLSSVYIVCGVIVLVAVLAALGYIAYTSRKKS